MSIYLDLFLYLYLYLSIYLSIYLAIYLPLYMYIYIYIHMYICDVYLTTHCWYHLLPFHLKALESVSDQLCFPHTPSVQLLDFVVTFKGVIPLHPIKSPFMALDAQTNPVLGIPDWILDDLHSRHFKTLRNKLNARNPWMKTETR